MPFLSVGYMEEIRDANQNSRKKKKKSFGNHLFLE